MLSSITPFSSTATHSNPHAAAANLNRSLHLARSHAGEVFRYFVVSTVCLALDFAILIALTELGGLHYLVSNAIAFCIATTIGYAWCIVWVFNQRRLDSKHWEYVIFIGLGVGGLAINEFALWAFVQGTGVHYTVGKLGASGASFLFNYLSRKLVLFT